MTVAEGVGSIVLWCVNLGLAGVLIFWCRRKYRVDAFRYRLVVYRDELFDLALDGTLDFSDQAYVLLRQSINSMLRFSHKVSLVRVIAVYRCCRGSDFDEMRELHDSAWHGAISALSSDEARNRVQFIHDSYLIEVAKHTTLGWCLWICLGALSYPARQSSKRRRERKLVRQARFVEMEARRAGQAGEGSVLMPKAT